MKRNKHATNPFQLCYLASEEDDEAFQGISSLSKTTQVLFESHSGPRLHEPRHLYGVTGSSAQGLPRWPQECEVISEEIHHIDWAPTSPEPLCSPCSPENVSKCLEKGNQRTLVYDTQLGQQCYFSGSRLNGRRSPLSQATVHLSGPDDTTLLFEGRFESGNLLQAFRVGEFDYELTLRPDLYTLKHTQWFYFQVKNMRMGVRYRFTITNLLKRSSLYGKGQQPLLYSERKARDLCVGWHRVGQDMSYHSNGRVHLGHPCYSLSWTLLFPFDRDVCYFAHCYPYTYTKLWSHLAELDCNPRSSRFSKVRTLCRSLAGNLVPVVTITNPSRDETSPFKPAVVLTARVHPGETNSSWIMKGILDFLLGESPDAELLRDTFVFKLLPMLNPDGVVVGNYRCSLTGRDLNRSYRSKLRDSFPSVWATRRLVQRLCEERQVLLYCDLHGHSRKHNVFTYGCESLQQGLRVPHERVFPLMLHKNCPDMFSFPSCKFKVQRNKAGTGRVALWRLGVHNSFTLEASLCGSTVGQRKGTHFTTKDLELLGTQFCDTLLDYCDPDRTKYNICIRELQDMLRQDVVQAVTTRPADAVNTSPNTESPSESNSSDSDGSPAHLQPFDEVKSQREVLKFRKERNKTRMLKDKSVTNYMPLKIPPTISERQTPKTQQRHVSSGRMAPISVLYLVFNSERPAMTSKSEYLQHLMAEYVRSRLQIKLGPLLTGFSWRALQDGQASKHTSDAQIPPWSKLHLFRPTQLLDLSRLTTGEQISGTLSPVQFRGTTSCTTESSLAETDSLTQHLCKYCQLQEVKERKRSSQEEEGH